MRVYTVHLRRPVRDQDRDVVLVREGFAWGAFLFSALWALWNRMWLVAILLFVVELVVSLGLDAIGLDAGGQVVVGLALAIAVGFVGYDLKRWTLERHGFAEADVVAARGRDSAEQRFYDTRADVVSGLRP
jgi:hypothetical protein